MAEKSALVLIKEFFNMTLVDAMNEAKKLTPNDKAELAAMIAAGTGDTVKPPETNS